VATIWFRLQLQALRKSVHLKSFVEKSFLAFFHIIDPSVLKVTPTKICIIHEGKVDQVMGIGIRIAKINERLRDCTDNHTAYNSHLC
jgi:hypothetical protein